MEIEVARKAESASAASLGFTGNSAFCALYGATSLPGDRLVVDIQVSPVPEPMPLAWLLGGLGAVGLICTQRSQGCADAPGPQARLTLHAVAGPVE